MVICSAQEVVVAAEGSMSKEPGIVLTVDEQSISKLSRARNTVLRGCALISPGEGTEDGSMSPHTSRPVMAYDTKGPGPMMSVAAPPWLAAHRLPSHSGFRTIGGRGNHGQSRTATTGETSGDDDVAALPAKKQQLAAAAIAWCKLKYAEALTAGSTADLTVPLRFDIGAGTQVEVRGPSGPPLHAMVEQVRIYLDAQRAEVYTALKLSGIRTAKENEEYGLDKPPLYEKYVKKWPFAVV